MLRASALALSVCLAACASPAAPPAEPLAPEALAGSYHVDHEITMYDGTDWVPETTTDRLAVVPVGDSLDVTFVLLHTNAHICEMHTRLGRDEDGWVAREPSEYDAGTCTLRLGVETDSLRLADVGGECRRTYCGARGFIDGISFPRSSRDPDTSWREDLR